MAWREQEHCFKMYISASYGNVQNYTKLFECHDKEIVINTLSIIMM